MGECEQPRVVQIIRFESQPLGHGIREAGIFRRPRDSSIDAGHDPEVGADVEAARIVWVDHDRVDGNIGNRGGGGDLIPFRVHRYPVYGGGVAEQQVGLAAVERNHLNRSVHTADDHEIGVAWSDGEGADLSRSEHRACRVPPESAIVGPPKSSAACP